MIIELLKAVGVAGAILLIASGALHTRAPAHLRATLRAHGILAPAAIPPTARLLGPAQLVLGLALLIGVVPGGPVAGIAGLLATALFAAFTMYLGRLVAARTGQPCGCFGDDAPAGSFTLVRAGMLTVGALAVATGAAQPASWLVLSTGVLLAAALWLLPQVRWRADR